MNPKHTNIKCEHKSCKSSNATIKMNGHCYCSKHAYYRQTGRHLFLDMKEDKPESCWKWELTEREVA